LAVVVVETGDESTLAVLSSNAPVLVQVSSHAEAIILMEEAELVLALTGVWMSGRELDRRLIANGTIGYISLLETS
jgi:hypothetical protein